MDRLVASQPVNALPALPEQIRPGGMMSHFHLFCYIIIIVIVRIALACKCEIVFSRGKLEVVMCLETCPDTVSLLRLLLNVVVGFAVF